MSYRRQRGGGGQIHRYFKYSAGLVILAVAGMAAFRFFIGKPMSSMNSPVDKAARAAVAWGESSGIRHLFSNSGVVNRITDADREHFVNFLIRQACIDAVQNSDILNEAERIIQTRLEDLTGGGIGFKKPLH